MRFLQLFVLCALTGLAVPASGTTLSIGIDVSTSNPLVMSDVFARAASKYVHGEIVALKPGDWVNVRTFGDIGLAHFSVEKIQITRRNRADKVADMVARYIASLPSKSLKGQGSTNIISFLELGEFQCATGGHVLMLTDGIEASGYIKEKELLAGKPLPPPDANFLAGCEVTMFGFGQGYQRQLPPQAIKAARASWSAWMKAAGANFTARINP